MRKDVFVFRVNQTERGLIEDLATRLNRNQSDAVRFVVCEAAKALAISSPDPAPATAPAPQAHREATAA